MPRYLETGCAPKANGKERESWFKKTVQSCCGLTSISPSRFHYNEVKTNINKQHCNLHKYSTFKYWKISRAQDLWKSCWSAFHKCANMKKKKQTENLKYPDGSWKFLAFASLQWGPERTSLSHFCHLCLLVSSVLSPPACASVCHAKGRYWIPKSIWRSEVGGQRRLAWGDIIEDAHLYPLQKYFCSV